MMKIGEGGFRSIYEGTVQPASGKGPPIPVAVKKFDERGNQGYDEWLAEVQLLSVVSHPNVVKLHGYFSGQNKRGIHLRLVYEYMPNGSLDKHLFNRALPSLPWKTRLEIILGVAEGLAYLHEGMEVVIIYGDFKSSNVLLDENFKAKLSDFGLAREGPKCVTTSVAGTFGYIAPEYFSTGHLSIYGDVWSFGVVLYEVLTGRRATEWSQSIEGFLLSDCVKDFPPDSMKFITIVDPHLRNDYSLRAATRIAELAQSCLSMNPKDRPLMHQVVLTIKKAIKDTERTTLPASSSNIQVQTLTENK